MPSNEDRFRFLDQFKLTANWDDEEFTLFLAGEVRPLAVWTALRHLEGSHTSRGNGRSDRSLGEEVREALEFRS
jgi:hypothetical protein